MSGDNEEKKKDKFPNILALILLSGIGSFFFVKLVLNRGLEKNKNIIL